MGNRYSIGSLNSGRNSQSRATSDTLIGNSSNQATDLNMSRDSSRLIMELDKYRREINRMKINPLLTTVEIDTLTPVVNICAKARADYIECLMDLATSQQDSCTASQVEQLRQHRLAYEELVSAANALETVIKRGYVDVKER